MPNLNFRRFKYIVLYVGALIMIGATLYWFLDLAANMQTVDQNRTAIRRLWTVITSREGVVIWSGLIAVFILATILVERRLDTDRDLKWRRRKARLDHKAARLDRRKTLSDEQMTELLAARRRGSELHAVAVSGGRGRLQEDIGEWENQTSELIRSAAGNEPADRFLHEPVVPVAMAGHAATGYNVGRVKVRMGVLNEIIKTYSE